MKHLSFIKNEEHNYWPHLIILLLATAADIAAIIFILRLAEYWLLFIMLAMVIVLPAWGVVGRIVICDCGYVPTRFYTAKDLFSLGCYRAACSYCRHYLLGDTRQPGSLLLHLAGQ